MFIAYYKSSALDNLFFIEERKMGRRFFFGRGRVVSARFIHRD
jgi:hypothetical protein